MSVGHAQAVLPATRPWVPSAGVSCRDGVPHHRRQGPGCSTGSGRGLRRTAVWTPQGRVCAGVRAWGSAASLHARSCPLRGHSLPGPPVCLSGALCSRLEPSLCGRRWGSSRASQASGPCVGGSRSPFLSEETGGERGPSAPSHRVGGSPPGLAGLRAGGSASSPFSFAPTRAGLGSLTPGGCVQSVDTSAQGAWPPSSQREASAGVNSTSQAFHARTFSGGFLAWRRWALWGGGDAELAPLSHVLFSYLDRPALHRWGGGLGSGPFPSNPAGSESSRQSRVLSGSRRRLHRSSSDPHL